MSTRFFRRRRSGRGQLDQLVRPAILVVPHEVRRAANHLDIHVARGTLALDRLAGEGVLVAKPVDARVACQVPGIVAQQCEETNRMHPVNDRERDHFHPRRTGGGEGNGREENQHQQPHLPTARAAPLMENDAGGEDGDARAGERRRQQRLAAGGFAVEMEPLRREVVQHLGFR
jgi:hypothetical protein